ncbi:MAG: glucose 1-dehydrogenase [Hyphomicrobiales bacterium]|nr:glucose 1-dehydrogenase [Hyphomicrobiales bacterium]
MRLKDKVAVVTGGTSGIGRCIVERFVEEGAHVVFSGRRASLGAEVARATGAMFIAADAAREEDAAGTVAAAAKLGRLDILVNNAGMGSPYARVEKLNLDEFDRMIAVHVRGALAHMKYAAPIMRKQKSGSIINVASVGAHRAGFGSIFYGAAKAALMHLTTYAAVELGEDNIRANSLSPGGIATGIFGKALGLEDDAAEASAERVKGELVTFQPIPRAGLPEDVAAAAVFLASDESSFINGEDIVIDGGVIRGRRPAEVRAHGAGLKRALGNNES